MLSPQPTARSLPSLRRRRSLGHHRRARHRIAWRRGAVVAVLAGILTILATGTCCLAVGPAQGPTLVAALGLGFVLGLVLAVLLALEWRWGDRSLAISEATRRRLERLAHRDCLTRLPNRRLLERTLTRACAAGADGRRRFALHLVDLDGLKAINDRFGHQVGDDVLKAVGRRLRATLRRDDLVARLAGDEFAILQARATPETAEGLAARILADLRQPLAVGGGLLTPTASVGTALYGLDGADPPTLLMAADRALYAAKTAGRDGWMPSKPLAAALVRPRDLAVA